jgi:hypothetical protein
VPLGHFYNVLVIKCQHIIFELLCAKQAKSANHVKGTFLDLVHCFEY